MWNFLSLLNCKTHLQKRGQPGLLWVFFSIVFMQNCMVGAPDDPLEALQKAQGLDLSGETEIDTALRTVHSWSRACETRFGNLVADAYVNALNSDLAFMNGGGLRADQGVDSMPKGKLAKATVFKAVPFSNYLWKVRVYGYRIKQALEMSALALNTTKTFQKSDDHDIDGAQHGDCFGGGSGRFLHLSARLAVLIDPRNTPAATSGSGTSLQMTSQGNRVLKIIYDGSTIYDNSLGDISSGWAAGAQTCSIHHAGSYQNFTNSAACKSFIVGVSSFMAGSGGDQMSMFNSIYAEVNNDGSSLVLSQNEELGEQKAIIYNYLITRKAANLLNKPVIENRIQFVSF